MHSPDWESESDDGNDASAHTYDDDECLNDDKASLDWHDLLCVDEGDNFSPDPTNQNHEPADKQNKQPSHHDKRSRESTEKARDERARGWAFTLNNPTEEEEKALQALEPRYLIYGKEKVSTLHFQGYIYFETYKSFNQVKALIPRAHIEKAKGTPKQNHKYCTKDGDFFEKGEIPSQGKRKDIEIVRDLIRQGKRMKEIVQEATSYQAIRTAEKILEYEEKKREWVTEVRWYHGATGTGKTKAAIEETTNPWISGKNLKWWNGYDGHDHVILDDFRADFCTFHELLRILDRYPYRIEVKGGSRELLAKLIIITSPYDPQNVYAKTHEELEQLNRRITVIKEFK